MHLRCIAECLLGVGSADGAGDVDAIADADVCDALADGGDDASAVVAGCPGKRRFDRVVARADVGLDGVDAGGFEGDDDLARGRLRVVDLLDL